MGLSHGTSSLGTPCAGVYAENFKWKSRGIVLVAKRQSPTWLGRGRALVLVLLAAAYPFVSYSANVSGKPGVLGVAFPFLPLFFLTLGLAWSSRPRWVWLSACVVVYAILWRNRGLLSAHYSWAFLVEDAGTLTALCLLFARTLRSGRVPLITRLSTLVHGPLSALLTRYTRRVTQVWALLFGGLAAISVALFVRGPLPLWAFYANVLTPILMVAVFLGEYCIRRVVIPPDQCAGFLEVVRASHKHWRTIAKTDKTASSSARRVHR